MRTSLKRYETNEDYLRALFLEEAKLVLAGGSAQGEDEID
jgi:hypothetical protein